MASRSCTNVREESVKRLLQHLADDFLISRPFRDTECSVHYYIALEGVRDSLDLVILDACTANSRPLRGHVQAAPRVSNLVWSAYVTK